MDEVGGKVLDRLVALLQRLDELLSRRFSCGGCRRRRRQRGRDAERDGRAADEPAHGATIARAILMRYRGCGSKMFASYAIFKGWPDSSNAAKLRPRSTISVCWRAATTCANP